MNTRFGEKNVLVLQGGGALGSYQAGAVAALAASDYEPDWVAGISIGAINAAIICGNPPQRRVERLRELWRRMTSRIVIGPLSENLLARRAFNEFSAATTATFGVPGFFSPRPSPPLMWPTSETAVSVYGASALRDTLLELADFERINSGETRISVGAVNVRSGNFRFFDSTIERITPEHIMASGALPPGFPPVEIEGELYWDGGLVSNTPLQYVLDMGGPREDMCVFQIDLFSARGHAPTTLLDAAQREKDIRFSSRTRMNTDVFRDMQTVRRLIRRLGHKIPDALAEDPDWRALAEHACGAAVTIVQLIHRPTAYETTSKDYEFSRYTMLENWAAGERDVATTLSHPLWRDRTPPDGGVAIFDLAKEKAP
jgi:NTE family protein